MGRSSSARRRIVELLLDEADARGATLIPPTVTTVGNLPTELFSSPVPLTDDITSRRAWSCALRSVDRADLQKIFPQLPQENRVAEWEELAGLISGLHQGVAGEGHRFADVARVCSSGLSFDDGPRWDVLAAVQGRATCSSSLGRLWSKGSRPEAGWGGVCHGEGASTASSSIWGGPRAGATGGGRSGMRILVLYTPAASAVPRGS